MVADRAARAPAKTVGAPGGGRVLLLLARPLLVLAVLAGLGAYYVGLAGSLGSLTGQAAPREPGVSLERLSVSPGGTETSVVLRVTAGAEDLGPLSVFWIVSMPDTPQPWQEPRFVAPPHTLPALAAGTSAEVIWSGVQMPLPAGRYDVGAWVHRIVGPDQTAHLAGGRVGSLSMAPPLPSAMQLGPGWFPGPARGPLELEGASISQPEPDTQTVALNLTVRNRGQQPVDGSAFWLLSRYTDPQPYAAPYWHSEWLPIAGVAPGATQSVSWTDSIGLPAGTYGLSLWVHTDQPTGSEHSHGSLVIPLTLQTDTRHVLRHGPPGALRVASASLDGAGQLRLVLDNQDAADATVWLGADAVRDNRRLDWFRFGGEAQTRLPELLVPAHGQLSVTSPLAPRCQPDDRLARVRLFTDPRMWGDWLVEDVLVDACP